MTLITWLGLFVWVGAIALLSIPFRVKASGYVHDQAGLGYRLELDWGLGLVAVGLANGHPLRLYLFGLKVGHLPQKTKTDKKKKERKKKRRNPLAIAGWGRQHHPQLLSILRRFLRACHLTGIVRGRIGLPDPADTAKLHILGAGAAILPKGFRWRVTCRYDEEVVDLASEIRARVIIGQFMLIALGLLLRSENRQMLRQLPQT